MLSDALLSSPVIVGEDGTGATMSGGYEFGVDPNEDPELALVSFFIISPHYNYHHHHWFSLMCIYVGKH